MHLALLFPALHRRPDDDHQLAEGGLAELLRQRAEPAAAQLFVELGQLAGDGGRPIPEAAAQAEEGPLQPAAGLVDDQRVGGRLQRTEDLALGALGARQKAQKQKGLRHQAGGDEPRQRGRGPGDRDHGHPGLDRPGHQARAGIAEERSARVADERDRGAGLQLREQAVLRSLGAVGVVGGGRG